MKAPRNISGKDVAKLLSKFGYSVTRQKGSHIRLTHQSPKGSHHITIPDHNPLKIGTLISILNEAALHLGINRDEILSK